MQEKGYIYILTNPSFREDWIKIGVSSRPVDIRSKELDNTAVPLPFEIYASIKTTGYKKIEKIFHKFLTELANARIRKNREFFNIHPEKAMKYLEELAEMFEESVIIYKQRNIPKINKKYRINTKDFFYLKTKNANAKMQVNNGNRYLVMAGSVINSNICRSAKKMQYLRNKYKNYLSSDGVTLIKNLEFNSLSTAAGFVCGASVNGKTRWQTKDKIKLSNFIEYYD